MTEEQLRESIERQGFAIDEGNVIGGPFTPDGTVRIYEAASGIVHGEGSTLAEAASNAMCAAG